MDQIVIKKETLASRCDICHQNDSFDAVINCCKRCDGLNLEKTENLSSKSKSLGRFLFIGLRVISFTTMIMSGLISLIFILWLIKGGRYSVPDGGGMACGSVFYNYKTLFSALSYFFGFVLLFFVSLKTYLFSYKQLAQGTLEDRKSKIERFLQFRFDC